MRAHRNSTAVLVVAALLAAIPARAQVERLVILKVDGLPEGLVERYARENRLPSIQRVFGEGGAWLDNFYVRGLSLSAPSWSLLDTGRHLEVRGNVEYDRYTLRAYDYLNFFPLYVGYARMRRADMAGVELLDEQGVQLLMDRFSYQERFAGFQLYQRGVRWVTLESSLKHAFTGRSPKELFDEWQTGFSMVASLNAQFERELIDHLKDPRIKYLDLYTGDYDHVGHLAADPATQRHAIEEVDRLVGRVWTAIAASPLADRTALVLVSDHGMNSSEGIYSQGYSLVDWFSSAAGGAQHVLTNRHPLTEFKLRGLNPLVSEVITPSAESYYLAGQSAQYPTVMLDLDGNERASIGLRSNTLNMLHVLLQELLTKRLPGEVRTAALSAFFAIRDTARPAWQKDLEDLNRQMIALEERIREQQAHVSAQQKKFTSAERGLGLEEAALRQVDRLDSMQADLHGWSGYADTMGHLMSLRPSDFDPGKFKMEELIPRKSLGPNNSIADLQHYVTGPAPGGLVLGADGALDMERSFRTVDYFAALSAITVRNNVQKDVGPRPVDFIAVRAPHALLAAALPEEQFEGDGIWLWRSPEQQALILVRRGANGAQEIRYLPVAHLQAESGGLNFDRAEYTPGLPLELCEDPELDIDREGAGNHTSWLSQWHSEQEWFRAVHRTHYSNGVIGLTEELLYTYAPADDDYPGLKRRLRRTDLLVFTNDHWNFNVRGFNPGGNHGSFLRISTHSTLLFAGGAGTGLPRGVHIGTPYDSLSLVPTLLTLMDRAEPDLPGPVIQELLPPAQ
jgi:hypothetical protein